MVTVAVIAAALWRSGPILPVVGFVAALRYPLPTAVLAGGWAIAVRLRRIDVPSPDDEARVLERLVSELEGGASPRAAIVAVADSGPVDVADAARLVEAGMPLEDVASSLGDALPHNGRLVAAAWALAGSTGAAAVPIMRLLGRRAAERGRLDRERRALTAQSRATAWLIAGLPMSVLLVLLASGRLSAGPALPLIAMGVGLQVAGLAVVVAMLRRPA